MVQKIGFWYDLAYHQEQGGHHDSGQDRSHRAKSMLKVHCGDGPARNVKDVCYDKNYSQNALFPVEKAECPSGASQAFRCHMPESYTACRNQCSLGTFSKARTQNANNEQDEINRHSLRSPHIFVLRDS